MQEITLVPFGGLGNRLKTVASAVRLAIQHGRRLTIYWFRDPGLNCRADTLFSLSPDAQEYVTLVDSSFPRNLLCDRPRIKNLFIPRILIPLQFRLYLHGDSLKHKLKEVPDYGTYIFGNRQKGRILISSCWELTNDPEMMDFILPSPAVMARRERLMQGWSGRMVGVHIRRGDHGISIAQSPTSLFIARMEGLIDEDPDTRFFLATDSIEEREMLQRHFLGRVYTSESTPERDSADGILDAYAELLTLSATSVILGSSRSTFSRLAARIGHSAYHEISLQAPQGADITEL